MKLFTSIILATAVSIVSFPFSADAASIRGGDVDPAMVESSASENVVDGSPAGVEEKDNNRGLTPELVEWAGTMTAYVGQSFAVGNNSWNTVTQYTKHVDDKGMEVACSATADILRPDDSSDIEQLFTLEYKFDPQDLDSLTTTWGDQGYIRLSHESSIIQVTKESKKPWNNAGQKMDVTWNKKKFTPAELVKVGTALPSKNRKLDVLDVVSKNSIFRYCQEADEALAVTAQLFIGARAVYD